MTVPIPAGIIFSVFFLLAAVSFYSLLDIWSNQAGEFSTMHARQVDRVNSSLSISSAGPTETDLDCNNFVASVVNAGSVDIVPVDDGDVLVEYTDAGGSKVSRYLDYGATAGVTGNSWTIASLSSDTRNPNQWDARETATIRYSIESSMKAGSYGSLLVNSPLGVGDMEYFRCTEPEYIYLYLHSETNDISGTDYYKMMMECHSRRDRASQSQQHFRH